MPYDDPKTLAHDEFEIQPVPDLPFRPLPFPPLFLNVSGRYVRRARLFAPSWPFGGLTPVPDGPLPGGPLPEPLPGREPLPDPLPLPRPLPRPVPAWRVVEELRLDVDGNAPQMAVSGVVHPGLAGSPLHWIANLAPVRSNVWEGAIWYKDGNAALLPQTQVRVVATRSLQPAERKATVTFSGDGAPNVTRVFTFESPHFHKVEFEYDHVAGSNPVFAINTGDHPNRPATLPTETLTIETVFRRAGFAVSKSGGDNVIPISGAGADQRWSDQEMHDAMQVHWSRFADKPQWALWVFWAALHEQGTSLGGIMFDDIGPNHRQGTAIFSESFISNAPAGDANPAAWVARMRFWTAVHEMGHAFNLAHSWQKQHPPHWGTPWIPLSNEEEARSFMNYPFRVDGNQTAFFADFAYRFSDQELLFMRHAPQRFVQMGNADWFDNHGFQEAMISPEPRLRLAVRVNRERPVFEFLEPAVVELKLTNVSGRPMVVDRGLLEESDELTVIVKRDRQPARKWHPFATRCTEPEAVVLHPGESLYQSLFVAVGTNGWDVAEPGRYTIQACLHHEGEDIVSPPLALRILPPSDHGEEALAQDVLTDEVGRVMAFDGSRVLGEAVDTLKEVADRLKKKRAARHALVALSMTLGKPRKVLSEKKGAPVIEVAKADPGELKRNLKAALQENAELAAETLGHIDYNDYVSAYADMLLAHGDTKEAERSLMQLEKTLSARKVLASVIQAVRRKRESIAPSGGKR